MKDYQVSKHNIDEFWQLMLSELEDKKVVVVDTRDPRIGRWSMTRLWRSWVSTIGQWMADNGATMPLTLKDGEPYGSRPFNAEDAHQLFTYKLLGEDEKGNRLSWSKSGRDGMRPATKEERLHAMNRLEQWATERGIKLMNPRENNEYQELMREQEK